MPWQKIFEQTRGDFFLVLPEAMLVFFGLAILLTDFFLTKPQKSWNALTAMLGVVFSGGSLYMLREYASPPFGPAPGFYDSIRIDPFFIFFGFLFLASAALVILISVRYMEIENEQHGEYYALMLFATVGMMFLACGNDLVVLFLGLETMALSFYVLSGFLRRDRRSNEAAMKYMLMGAFSSGILAYGFSILYGLAGSTNLAVIQEAIQRRHVQVPGTDLLTFLALGTVAAGIFFKIAGVPFHQWAPDVYEGAPTGITAFVSGASKAASFALLLRLFLTVFWPVNLDWVRIMEAVGVLSLTVGTLAAITQTNIKRLLAYSSIAQVGYILLGFVAAVNPDGTLHERGLQAMAFYLFVYVFFNTGAFAVVILLRRKGIIGDEIDDLNGLIERSPGRGGADADFSAVAGGDSADGGIRRKTFDFLGLDRDTPYGAGGSRGALYSSGGVLLFPNGRGDVGARVQRYGAAGDYLGAEVCAGCDGSRDARRRNVSRAVSAFGDLFYIYALWPMMGGQ